MARIKKDKEEGTLVDFKEVREKVRREIEKRYGTVYRFLNSEKGEEFGGLESKVYLSKSGPVNYDLISRLCEYLGIGKLTRKIVVTRTYFYRMLPSDPTSEETA